MIGRHLKCGEHLIEHLPVLSGDAHPNIELSAPAGQKLYDGAQLNRFRPGAENEQYLFGLAQENGTPGVGRISAIILWYR